MYSSDEEGKVKVQIRTADIEGRRVSWPRPPAVCSNHDTRISTEIPLGLEQPPEHKTTWNKVIMLLWYTSDPKTSLPNRERVNEWATKNPRVDVVLFTNCEDTGIVPPVYLYPLQALEFNVAFPEQTLLYDFVDFAKLKMLQWALSKYEFCMVADYPKNVPLEILPEFWASLPYDLMFADGYMTKSSLVHENWLYIAKRDLAESLRPLIDIYETILNTLGVDLIPRLHQSLSSSVVHKLALYLRKITHDHKYVSQTVEKDIASGLRMSVPREQRPEQKLPFKAMVEWLRENSSLEYNNVCV